MKKNEKRMNFLTLILFCTAIMGLFLMTGCGKGCGQIPKCGSTEDDELQLSYISIPMCGGCLTSEWGCSSCLWGEYCAISTISSNVSEENNYSNINCGELYYGSRCTGCGNSAEYVYSGIGAGKIEGKDFAGCYYGSTAGQGEYVLGYYDGCACATKNEDNTFAYIGPLVEFYVDNS